MTFRVPVFTLAFATLVACAAHQSVPPAAVKPHSEPAAKPRAETAAPVAKPRAESLPSIQVVTPENAADGKAQIRKGLAKNERDAPTPSDLGYYLDVLQGRLNQSMGPDVTIARRPDGLTIDLTQRLKFGSEGIQLSATDRDILLPLVKVLVEYKTTLVSIRTGAVDANAETVRQANLRSQVLARYLAESGIAANHIVVISTPSIAASNEPLGVLLTLEPILLINEGRGARDEGMRER